MAQTKKATQIFEQSRITKQANLSRLEQEVGNAVIESVKHFEGEQKRIASFVKLTKVVEVPNGKQKPSVLVYISFRGQKVLMSSIFKKLINDIEKKLKRNVLMLSTRNIQSRWIKANKTQKRPYSRTLTAVYSAILDELLMPGVIIGQRTRVKLDGSSFTKVTVEKNEQHFLEDRVEAIQNAYRKLTTREVQIDFQKEPTFYTLKKGERK